MNLVFADTYYFLARLNSADPEFARVARLTRNLSCHIVTTQWVLTEVADALCHPRHRDTVSNFFQLLEANSGVTIVPASADLFRQGMYLFDRRRDKDWPLTDCISFVVMADEKITDALTGDKHFAQAGFKPLLA
jgi:hypothetical protein